MNGQFTIGALSPARYFSFIAVTLGLLFAFIGESDAESIGVLRHLFRWQLQVAVPMALLIGSHLALQKTGLSERLGPWLSLTVSGLVGAVLATGPSLLIELSTLGQLPDPQSGELSLPGEFVDLAPPVVVAWVAINAPWLLGFRIERNKYPAHATAKGAEGDNSDPALPESVDSHPDTMPPFMALLPEDVRGEPIYLKSELHYLLVVTPRGKGLILYALRDAMEELSHVGGLHPHRSYWVNRSQVARLARDGREADLILKDGTKIPVSRYRAAAIRQEVEPQLQ